MSKIRLDQALVARGLVASRSQAESYIRLGKVKVDQQAVTKPGHMVHESSEVTLDADEQYVSRAGFKLASVAELFQLDFTEKTVLDVGSSTGGFTDFALRRGARKVVAVDVGTDQLHLSLRNDMRIELHEKTDIRDYKTTQQIDIVLIDVSFISLREILPSIARFCQTKTQVVTMVKPQFEAGFNLKHKGVIKNDTMRRKILREFELWAQDIFKIENKADSDVHGAKGNKERFYLLKPLK